MYKNYSGHVCCLGGRHGRDSMRGFGNNNFITVAQLGNTAINGQTEMRCAKSTYK